MTQAENTSPDFTWRVAAATLLPIAMESLYFISSRWPSSRFTTASDFTALALSVLIGAAFVWSLPLRLSRRIFALLLYIPTGSAVLFFYTFVLAALVFGDGL